MQKNILILTFWCDFFLAEVLEGPWEEEVEDDTLNIIYQRSGTLQGEGFFLFLGLSEDEPRNISQKRQKRTHILERSRKHWWKTLFDFMDLFFRVPPGLFWDATTKMMMCLESWRSKYYFSSDGIHVPWFQGRNFSSKRSCSNYKNFFSGIRKSSRMAVKKWEMGHFKKEQ